MEHVYVDGSFCRKTKKYGAGVYKQRGLTDDAEQTFFGECLSSSEAEYKAVLHGLQVAFKSEFTHIAIMNDCESVVLECNNLFNGKEPDDAILLEIKEMAEKFDSVRFIKVPRGDNRAHALSKIALRDNAKVF